GALAPYHTSVVGLHGKQFTVIARSEDTVAGECGAQHVVLLALPVAHADTPQAVDLNLGINALKAHRLVAVFLAEEIKPATAGQRQQHQQGKQGCGSATHPGAHQSMLATSTPRSCSLSCRIPGLPAPSSRSASRAP